MGGVGNFDKTKRKRLFVNKILLPLNSPEIQTCNTVFFPTIGLAVTLTK